jgi:hypothetical protein
MSGAGKVFSGQAGGRVDAWGCLQQVKGVPVMRAGA